MVSLILAMLHLLSNDAHRLREGGFFQGYANSAPHCLSTPSVTPLHRLRTASAPPPHRLRTASALPPQETELAREMQVLADGPLGKLTDATEAADKPTD